MTIGSRVTGTYQQTPHYTFIQWNGEDDSGVHTRENSYTKLWETGLQTFGEYCAKIWNRPAEHPDWGCSEWRASYFPSDPASRDWNQASLKNLAKIAEDIRGHELDLGNSVAEGNQTVRMTLDALRDITKAARNLKHGNIAEAVRNLTSGAKPGSIRGNLLSDRLSSKNIAERYLGFTYGVTPLLSDIYEISKVWEGITAGPRHKDYIRTSKGIPSKGEFIHGEFNRCFSSVYSVRQRIRVSEDASTQHKLGLLDPLGIGWELTPFSFVADWFIPISTYLDTLNLFNGLNATVLETRKWSTHVETTSVLPAYEWEPWYGGVRVLPHTTQTFGGFSRSFSQSVSVPPPRFKPLGKALSPKHLTNAVALARVAILGAFKAF